MPGVKALIQLATRGSVQAGWDGWRRPRDESSGDRTSGAPARTSGGAHCLSVATIYLIVAGLVVASSVVGTFSTARDVGWRLASPGNLWEPAMWYATGNAVTLALLPVMRRAALVIRTAAGRWRVAAPAVLGLTVAYIAVHIVGMFVLRKLAYAAAGWHWTINWGPDQIVYEARKDLFSFVALTAIFWFAERSRMQPFVELAPTTTPPGTTAHPTAPSTDLNGLWLRDGRTSLLVDPRDILTVASAGNYVEYVLADGRRHLIRATLQAEESRLAAFGIARVHRTRLINLKRVVALESRPSGDFDIRLDSGEVVVGSRRFRNAVANIGG